MTWDNINLKGKIKYLKMLMENSINGTFELQDVHIVRALYMGTKNTYTHEDLRFDVTSNHIGFLKKTWDTAITNQKNNDVINPIIRRWVLRNFNISLTKS